MLDVIIRSSNLSTPKERTMISTYTSESTAEHFAAKYGISEDREYAVIQTGIRAWTICPVENINDTATLDVSV